MHLELSRFLVLVSLGLAMSCEARRPPRVAPAPRAGAVTATRPNAVEGRPALATSASPDDAEAAVPVLPDDPTWGDPLAAVTIVEFADYQCPYSQRAQETLGRLRETYGPSKLRIVWKNNPLPFHSRARPAAEAAMAVLAAGGNLAFWRFHALAFAGQRELTDENLSAWARTAGVDPEAFERARGGAAAAAHIERDIALAGALGARGTPNFRVNGIEISGAHPFEKFQAVIDSELGEVERLVKAGVPRQQLYATRVDANVQPGVDDKAPIGSVKPKADEDTNIWNIPVVRQDPVLGPADALVTIVMWGDYQCPFTQRVQETLATLRAEYPEDLRLVWRDNPLPFHKRARAAATLARIAFQAQGNAGFWRAHDRLLESQPKLEDDDLRVIAEELKLPWEQVKTAIEKDRFAGDFEASTKLAGDFQARGTPHFFVNGYRINGAQPYEKFRSVIEQQLERARSLVAAGTPRARIYTALMKDAKGPPPPETKEAPPPPADAPFRGSAKARVVVQHWGDFQCPFSERVRPTLEALEKKYPGRVKLVWRHLPLPFHGQAELAAEAAVEAQRQQGNAGFWRYHDALFAAQKQPGGLERPSLEAIAEAQGLDLAAFRDALDRHTHLPRVKADAELAQELRITGTPSSVVGKYFVSGAQPLSAFVRAFELASKP